MSYDFDRSRAQWLHVPVDAVGYLSTTDMLAWPDDKLRETIQALEVTRYQGARNFENRWRSLLGLDTTHDKHVLDFGCGIGVEALQFARSGNRVTVADINADSVALAQRVLRLHGYEAAGALVTGEAPFVDGIDHIDVFYANGVLHHIPYPIAILRRAAELLLPGGEIRLLLYSDRLWLQVVQGPLPPVEQPIHEHPGFQSFHQALDAVGEYADWYNEEKLRHFFGAFLSVRLVGYMTEHTHFMAAILVPTSQDGGSEENGKRGGA